MSLLRSFLDARLDAVLVEPGGQERHPVPCTGLVLPGSFNPLHQGHVELAAVAARLVKARPLFELSTVNADKGEMSASELNRRLAQFAGRFPVCVTRAPTFGQKSEIFPGAAFVVGADTAERILAPRYYRGEGAGLEEALRLLRERGCRFLVAGRLLPGGRFLRLGDIPVPDMHRDLFEEIPEEMFRADISSTQLRQQSGAQHG